MTRQMSGISSLLTAYEARGFAAVYFPASEEPRAAAEVLAEQGQKHAAAGVAAAQDGPVRQYAERCCVYSQAFLRSCYAVRQCGR